MKRVLLTGGGGYIGSAVLQALLGQGHTLTVIDGKPRPEWAGVGRSTALRWIPGDVRDRNLWEKVVGDVDVILHLAAVERAYAPERVREDYEVNALSVVYLMEACRNRRVTPTVVLASSANIYGQVDSLPVTERMPDRPARVWSAHKLLGEQYAAILSAEGGVPVTVLRLANVYGLSPAVGRDEHIVINKVLRRALAGGDLQLYNNAACLRDYIYIHDVVAAFLAAAEMTPTGFTRYIIGSGEAVTIEHTWRLLAEVVEQLIGGSVQVARDRQRVLDPSEYRHFVADTTLFKQATNWQAEVSLAEGLRLTAQSAMGMMRSYATRDTQKK